MAQISVYVAGRISNIHI